MASGNEEQCMRQLPTATWKEVLASSLPSQEVSLAYFGSLSSLPSFGAVIVLFLVLLTCPGPRPCRVQITNTP